MISLFIDTHDKNIIEVLFKDGNILDINEMESTRHHSENVMPMLKDLLEKNNITVKEINEILVINGPGSFTGVRIGVTIAKTLAYTLNIPIKTMLSLEAMAVSFDKLDKKLSIVADVKGVFTALYDKDNNELMKPCYMPNDEFKKYIKDNGLEDNIVDQTSYEYNKIYQAFINKDTVNPHKVKPVYIKVIEALKND